MQIVSYRTADQRHHVGRSLTRRDAADEQPVLPADRDLFHQLFTSIVVDRHVSTGNVKLQRVPVIVQIADGCNLLSAVWFGWLTKSV